jgi:RHS repeat-associated protein
MERFQVSDRLNIQVNLANGNVVVVARDLTVRGTGLNLAVDHVFNNQAAGAAGAFGAGWTSSYGPDVKLVIFSDHVDFHDPTGYVATYTKSGSTFITPPGMDADLTLSGTTYTLTFHVSNEKWTFNSSGQWTAQTDRNGNHLTFAYSSGNLSTINDTQGRVTHFTTSSSRITSITDPTGLSFGGFTYDGSGRLIRYTDRAGTPITFGYDGSGNLTSLTSPNGDTYTITYDTSQRITSLVQPLPGQQTATWTYSYSTGTTTGTDPNGHAAVFHFDASGRQTSAVDPLGHTRSQTWTNNNDINTLTNALSQSSTFGYDGINNLTSSQLPTGATTTLGYTNPSHPYLPSSITDAQNMQLTFTYDTNGNLLKVHNPALNIDVLTRTYNANGTVATQTDGNGHTTTLSYDAAGNLLTVTPPAPRGPVHYTYDTLSRVVTVTDGNGVTISYTYDLLDRITQVTNTSGGQTDVRQTKAYDRNGNATVVETPQARTEFLYTPRNELRSSTQVNTTSTGEFTVTYGYDPAGNVKWIENPYGVGATLYDYDAANRLTTLTTPQSEQVTFSYDNANRRTAITNPGGSATHLTYDASSRVQYLDAIGSGNTLLNRSTYSYVFNGADSTLLRSLVGWASPNPNGTAASFTYDGLNRLLTGGIYSYGYDAASNLTSATVQGSFTINNANQPTSQDSTTLAWDKAGNWSYASWGNLENAVYSPTNQKIAADTQYGRLQTNDYATADQTQPFYISRDQGDNTFEVETYDYSALGIMRVNRSYYTYTGGLISSTQLTVSRDPQGRPIALHDSAANATYYYFSDAQGSTQAVFDSFGNSVGGYTYEPYGETTVIDDAGALNPFRWQGALQDPGGAYLLGYRIYFSNLARFISPEPRELNPVLQPAPGAPALNTYQYAGSDPINNTDTTGLQLTCITAFTGVTLTAETAIPILEGGGPALLAVLSPEIVAAILAVAPELAGAALLAYIAAYGLGFTAC